MEAERRRESGVEVGPRVGARVTPCSLTRDVKSLVRRRFPESEKRIVPRFLSSDLPPNTALAPGLSCTYAVVGVAPAIRVLLRYPIDEGNSPELH